MCLCSDISCHFPVPHAIWPLTSILIIFNLSSPGHLLTRMARTTYLPWIRHHQLLLSSYKRHIQPISPCGKKDLCPLRVNGYMIKPRLWRKVSNSRTRDSTWPSWTAEVMSHPLQRLVGHCVLRSWSVRSGQGQALLMRSDLRSDSPLPPTALT